MKTLDELRQKIDEIDDQLHDLIMSRTQIVEQVRAVKSTDRVKIRPAREAEIIYRLMARHQGAFPKRELVRMWRELIVATLRSEGPFSVAVFADEEIGGFWGLARDQYGSFTPMTAYSSTRRIIEVVSRQDATVGVLPLPVRSDPDPWWRRLAATGEDVPRVIAR
ncbi:MAG: chorismate mutase, partial [Rhodospirillaceae bacterium]|nr:chorismate mutase [Rhodospirillaceae bacterium]